MVDFSPKRPFARRDLQEEMRIESAAAAGMAFLKSHKGQPLHINYNGRITLADAVDQPSRYNTSEYGCGTWSLFCVIMDSMGGYDYKLFDRAVKRFLLRASQNKFRVENHIRGHYQNVYVRPPLQP